MCDENCSCSFKASVMDEVVNLGGPVLKIFKLAPDVQLPIFATKNSACFDCFAYMPKHSMITYYTDFNKKVTRVMSDDNILIFPGQRYLIPLGIKMNIPVGYSVRIHSRSGISLKMGLIIPNSEGIIDSDYREPVYMIVSNISNAQVTIKHGDRICQGEMVKDLNYTLEETLTDLAPITDRIGGLGSTGV